MNRRFALLAPLALLPSLPAVADIVPLTDDLNGPNTVETGFTQANADGTISTGRIFIHRPGRVRFEHAPPDESLVIAGAGSVGIFNAQKAARLVEQMEDEGVVTRANHVGKREILIEER